MLTLLISAVVVFIGAVIGANCAAYTIISRIRRDGFFRHGEIYIVGRIHSRGDRHQISKAKSEQVSFRCDCAAAPLMLPWDDPRFEPLMLALDHADDCRWLSKKVEKSLKGVR